MGERLEGKAPGKARTCDRAGGTARRGL